VLERLAEQPPDPLLAVIGMFRTDPRPWKIDLGVGVYRDESGRTPVMRAVKAAEARLLETQDTKAYVGPGGDLVFIDLMRDLVFGGEAPAGRLVGLQTPGGTAALRAAADLLARAGARTIWAGRPTWANHDPIFAAAGLELRSYDYFDPVAQTVAFDRMAAALERSAVGDVVLLQASCHNPTGADLSPEQWAAVADLVRSRRLIPLIDVAYQGVGRGLEADVAGVRQVVAVAEEALVAVSCSKTFGLYRERTGAVFTLTADAGGRTAATSNMLAIARANYSMPPDHGAAVVRTILEDPDLTREWRAELDGVRGRIRAVRALLAGFGRCGGLDLVPLAAQNGMFSQLPLDEAQIRRLREDHAIYMTASGRVNLAGLKVEDVEPLIRALTAVFEAA
jgi:aromatic-amino-acid transaminase